VPNNYFVPLAIYLAIYTAMRRAEIMNLMWADIDIVNRRIRIRKSKTDKATGKDGTDKSMDATYTGKKLLLDGIRDKLDRYALEGMTLKEVMEKHGGIEWEDVLGSDMVLPMNEHFDMVAHPKRLAVTHTK